MRQGRGFTPDLHQGGYYVTPQRFAQMVGLGDRQTIVESWIEGGALPSRCIGGQVLVDLGALFLIARPDQS